MIGSFDSIEDVCEYLGKIPKFQDKGSLASHFALDNISRFCSLIGNPQEQFPSIHVAGTNGKGTTCYLLEAVYKEAGFKTGMFTSPHLAHYNERFRINGEDVGDALILEFFQSFEEELKEVTLTYFEISTALSFWLFAKEKVDLAIIETGLGGRLDSTNIINSELSVITSIGLDHQDILGNTELAIAKEKAGIIKPNRPVVLGNISGDNEEVIRQIADKNQSKVFRAADLGPEWDTGNCSLEKKSVFFLTQLREEVNKWNIASIYLAIQVLNDRFPISKEELKQGIEEFKGAPARFEKLSNEKDWYFSGAHNLQALASTLETVKTLSDKEPVLIFSLMQDKVNKEVIMLIDDYDQKFYHELNTERSASLEEIEKVMTVKSIDEMSFKTILKEFDTSLVIFTGSFYFYSTVKRWVSNC
jgi:dihydrofolate synthase/folylpolyglutamate synthase